MSKLPSLTARAVVRALKRAGFVEDRQRGSHLILIHPAISLNSEVNFGEVVFLQDKFAEETGLVSGHDFSRAEPIRKNFGL